MTSYSCRRGTSRRKTPATGEELYRLPFRESRDDGKIVVHAGGDPPRCPDCCRGHLRWAEAGFVAWHRICDQCGSHWDLHPIPWGPARGPAGLVRWIDGLGEVPVDPGEALPGAEDLDDPPTWGDLVSLLTADLWAAAEREAPRMAGMTAVPGAWACRARFY